MKTIICNYYHILRIGSSLPNSIPEIRNGKMQHGGLLIREKMPVTEDYMNRINDNWKTSGKYFVPLKKETEEYEESLQFDIQRRQTKKAVQNAQDSKVLGSLLAAGVAQLNQNTAQPEPLKEEGGDNADQ